MYKGRDSVKVWFFPRNDAVPGVIANGAPRGTYMYPDLTWGAPAANFPFYPDRCDYAKHFNAHRMVFDLTFCVSTLSALLALND